jgi:hypothetical protein
MRTVLARFVTLAALMLVLTPLAGGLASIPTAGAANVTAPGPIHVGDTVSGSLAAASSHNQYSLFVNAPGASVYLQATGGTCDCTWALTGPNGSVFSQGFSDVPTVWLAPGA